MNKKFSTLMTAGFLVGGALFCNVNAENYTADQFAALIQNKVLTVEGSDLVVNLTENATLADKYVMIKTPGITLSANKGISLTGRLVVAAEGVTVKGIKFVNAPIQGDEKNGYWAKNTITAFADKISIEGNEFTEGTTTGDAVDMVVSNCLVLFPQVGKAVAYNVMENKFSAKLIASKNGGYTSTGVIISQGAVMNESKPDPLIGSGLAGYNGTTTAVITDKTFDAKAIATNNTFTKCFTDYLCLSVEQAATKAVGDQILVFGQVTYSETLGNAIALADVITSANAASTVVVKGSSYEVQEALATLPMETQMAVASANAAIECDNGFVLLGNAELPADTEKEVVDIFVAAPESAYGQKLVASVASGSYYLLSDGTNGFVTSNAAGAITSVGLNASNPAALWKVEVTKPAGGVNQYTFTNKAYADVQLKLNNTTVFTTDAGKYDKGFVLLAGAKYVGSTNGVPTAVDAPANAVFFGLYEAGLTSYSAKDLLGKLGAGFDMTIDTEKDADAVIEGNPFTGILKPVSGIAKDGDDYEAVEFTSLNNTSTSFYLQTSDGKFIALDKNATWSEKTANLNGKIANRGYKFVTLTAKEAYEADAKDYVLNFNVSHSAAIDDATEIVLTANGFGRLYVATVKGENLLTTSTFLTTDDEVWPYTIFGGSNLTDLKTLVKKSFWTIVNANVVNEDNNGKVYAIPAGAKENPGIVPTTGGAYMDTTNVLLTSPEAQWAPTVVDGKLVLTNRENPDVKIIGWSLYNVDAAKGIYTVAGTKDTINISLVDRSKLDGFASYGENYLKNTEFNMAIETLLGNAYMSENHAGKHQIGLVDNVAGAATWKLEKEFAGRPDSKTATDSVYVISKIGYFADNKWKTVDDTLAILPYVIKNVANGEYITYSKDANIKGYVCDDSKAKAAALRFALKMKPDNTFNLVEITGTKTGFNGALDNNKMFGGVSAKEGLVNRIGKYNQTENDRVVILPLDAPEYRKLAMGDTIKVYRSESTDEAQVLFEQGEFLSIQNAVQFPKINPAMYVDTAFVDRADNNRWEYLLAVDKVRHFDANDDCGVDGHPSHKADTTYGRFLVNLVDSAFAYGKTHLHDNKFINDKDGEQFAKLGFVSGYHTHDTLYVARPNGKFDALSLTRVDNPYSVAKFAFRIVDKDSKDFIIETGYKAYNTTKLKYSEEPGFLKWLNGVVVVVPSKENADIFNLNADESRIPTDNEGIETTEVSVIAGNGSVTINNAAGKTIAISNILGQAIANTVLSSDNATISVPAGIVVVAVEGEAAVKAIVK